MSAPALSSPPRSHIDNSPARFESDRPRERLFFEGAAALSDIELLALLLGTGVPGQPAVHLAATVLHSLGGLRGLGRAGPRELAALHGVGTAKAARTLAAFELGRRACSASYEPLTVSSATDVHEWATTALSSLAHEEVWLLCLDAKNRLLTRRRIGLGGLHGCALTPKDVLRPAIRDCASAIVLVHNHPSGDPTPSGSDLQMTHTVADAARTVGLQLLDHIVVGSNSYTSLHEMGALDRWQTAP